MVMITSDQSHKPAPDRKKLKKILPNVIFVTFEKNLTYLELNIIINVTQDRTQSLAVDVGPAFFMQFVCLT